MEAVAAGSLRSIGRARSRPERRMRLLERLELDGHVGIVIKFAVKRERPPGQRLAQDLQRLEIHLLSIGEMPRPTPSSKRPALSWSSMQISSTTRSGWWSGRV